MSYEQLQALRDRLDLERQTFANMADRAKRGGDAFMEGLYRAEQNHLARRITQIDKTLAGEEVTC